MYESVYAHSTRTHRCKALVQTRLYSVRARVDALEDVEVLRTSRWLEEMVLNCGGEGEEENGWIVQEMSPSCVSGGRGVWLDDVKMDRNCVRTSGGYGTSECSYRNFVKCCSDKDTMRG